jgi:hypothetical protein
MGKEILEYLKLIPAIVGIIAIVLGYVIMVTGLSQVGEAEEYLANWNYSIDISPGKSVSYPIVVPNNCDANITIGMALGDTSEFTVYVYIIGTHGVLYQWQTSPPFGLMSDVFDKQITLKPGSYIIELDNPSNTKYVIGYMELLESLQCK